MQIAFSPKNLFYSSKYCRLAKVKCVHKINRQFAVMSDPIEVPVQTQKLLRLAKSTIIPKLSENKHKGQYGRIGVVGGSLEYTGAPYFAAISALKLGADLAHVFCTRDAATVIKSYSPDLIVHPLLDLDDAVDQIAKWLSRLHVMVIGPGLGRDPKVQQTVISLIGVCQKIDLPLVIDADGLAIVNEDITMISDHRNVILTPNAIEFRLLFTDDSKKRKERMALLGDGVIILEKGARDKIHIPHTAEVYTLPLGGSARRCGGQGDVLSGTLATFFNWSLESNQSNPAFLAAFSASFLVKQCNGAAFKKYGRSMLASDMVNEIHNVFQNTFEQCD